MHDALDAVGLAPVSEERAEQTHSNMHWNMSMAHVGGLCVKASSMSMPSTIKMYDGFLKTEKEIFALGFSRYKRIVQVDAQGRPPSWDLAQRVVVPLPNSERLREARGQTCTEHSPAGIGTFLTFQSPERTRFRAQQTFRTHPRFR